MVQEFTNLGNTIHAIQYNGNSNKQEIEQFVGKELKSELESETAYVAGKGAPLFSLLLPLQNETKHVFRGDWVIKETFPTGDSYFYPCKNNIFLKKYSIARRLNEVVAPASNCVHKLDVHRPDLYPFVKLTHVDRDARILERLIQVADLGMEESGNYHFYIKGVFSGLYLELIWNYTDQEWKSYIHWVTTVIEDAKKEKNGAN
jgi:hypothetical protein